MATSKICVAYKAYFCMSGENQDKPWAPNFTCELNKRTLEGKVESFACLDNGFLSVKILESFYI